MKKLSSVITQLQTQDDPNIAEAYNQAECNPEIRSTPELSVLTFRAIQNLAQMNEESLEIIRKQELLWEEYCSNRR